MFFLLLPCRSKAQVTPIVPYTVMSCGLQHRLNGLWKFSPLGDWWLQFWQLGVRTSQISDIQQNANVVATVYLEGQVINRAPLIGFGAYHLKDETGTIWVLTNQVLPNLGDQVLIKGQTQFHSMPVKS